MSSEDFRLMIFMIIGMFQSGKTTAAIKPNFSNNGCIFKSFLKSHPEPPKVVKDLKRFFADYLGSE